MLKDCPSCCLVLTQAYLAVALLSPGGLRSALYIFGAEILLVHTYLPCRFFLSLQQAGMGLAALVAGSAVGAAPASAATGTAVEVMRLRFGDKLRRAAKMLDELQQDIANDVRNRS